jgi:glycosyltransferase involved in cell wall biosynthesis
VPHPVHLSPLGVPDRPRFGLPEDEFLVLSALDLRSTLARKNFNGLAQIYRQALDASGPRIRFVLKLTGSDQEPDIHAQVRRSVEGLGNLAVLEGDLTAGEISNLVASVDAVLAVHRAEGFGLLLAQGMRAAKPVIATGWSGNLEFMSDDGAALINYRLIPVVDPQRRYGRSHWADPDLEQALISLRRLAADRDEARALGLKGQAVLWNMLGGQQWAARAMQEAASASL